MKQVPQHLLWYIFFQLIEMKIILLVLSIFLNNLAIAQQPVADKSSDGNPEYYMMKNNHLLHFLNTGEVETVMSNATLSNGIVLTAKGEMAGKKAAKQKLVNGECIDIDGTLKSCAMLDSLLTKKIKSKNK
jgi:hypothetical protein